MNQSQTTLRPQKTFIRFHLPLILYAAAVLLASSLPQSAIPKLGFKWSDKVLHFAEYAIFAWLVFRSFTHLKSRNWTKRAFLLSFLFLVAFAGLDELYQSYIPGRHSDATDLLGDLIGGVFVLVFLRVLVSRQRKKSVSSA